MISMNKKYQTRDGQPVELLTTRARESRKWPVMGYIGDHVYLTLWSPEGIQDINGRRSNLDLVEVKPKRTLWLNVTRTTKCLHMTVAKTRMDAARMIGASPASRLNSMRVSSMNNCGKCKHLGVAPALDALPAGVPISASSFFPKDALRQLNLRQLVQPNMGADCNCFEKRAKVAYAARGIE